MRVQRYWATFSYREGVFGRFLRPKKSKDYHWDSVCPDFMRCIFPRHYFNHASLFSSSIIHFPRRMQNFNEYIFLFVSQAFCDLDDSSSSFVFATAVTYENLQELATSRVFVLTSYHPLSFWFLENAFRVSYMITSLTHSFAPFQTPFDGLCGPLPDSGCPVRQPCT